MAEKCSKLGALQLYDKLRREGLSPSVSVYMSALKACCDSRNLETGKRIHLDAAFDRVDSNLFVANSLLEMYSKLGDVAEARRVFDKMAQRNVFSWNSLIMGYAQAGDGECALKLFRGMQERGFSPDARSFLGALKACTSLASSEAGVKGGGGLVKMNSLSQGRELHSELQKLGFEGDVFLASSLVDMYSKCGSISDAREVFDKLRNPNIVCWNAIISGCTLNGENEQAWMLLSLLQQDGIRPDSWSFVAALKGCINAREGNNEKWLKRGVFLHRQIEQLGLDSNTFVGNSLLDMYSKLGRMIEARELFERMGESRSLVSWNTLLSGYVQIGEGEGALELFSRMRGTGLAPDSLTYIAVLNAFASLASAQKDQTKKLEWLARGEGIHSELRNRGFESNIFVANTLIDMYSKCGSLEFAAEIFRGMKQRSLVSWNVMMMAHAQGGDYQKSLELLEVMKGEGFSPDSRTYLAAIYSCSGLAEVELGERIQGKLLKLSSLEIGLKLHSELELHEGSPDVFVASALVDMYGKCGSMEDAQRVFDKSEKKDVVLWTALILGYAQCGEGEKALRFFSEMQAHDQKPNAFTYAAALNACIALVHHRGELSRCLETAIAIHSQLAGAGFDSEKLVASTLLNLYTKCGSMEDAQRFFDGMEQDVVSWTSLMLGYVEHEQGEKALELFWRLQREKGLKPDALTFSAALKACGSSACLETGKLIHEQAKRDELDKDLIVANSLIGFYGRCGSMLEAQQVFDSVEKKDGITWSALIAGYSHRGDARLVVELFERMRVEEDLHPDGVTFLSLLTACSHAGLVEIAKDYFRLMVSDYHIVPGVEHYTCMVDLLGRENRMDEAVEVITRMKLEGDSEIWTPLLDACRKWNNVDIAKAAFESIQNPNLQSFSSAPYVLMASMYNREI